MPPQSIDEVLTRLDEVIAEARHRQSRNGYFAALYRDVTARVAAAIEAGELEDDVRMERLASRLRNGTSMRWRSETRRRGRPARGRGRSKPLSAGVLSFSSTSSSG